MPKIKALYAWVIADAGPDDEGVPGFMDPRTGEWFPMMGADLPRAESFRPFVQEMANREGKSLKLIKSTAIEVVEVVRPKK